MCKLQLVGNCFRIALVLVCILAGADRFLLRAQVQDIASSQKSIKPNVRSAEITPEQLQLLRRIIDVLNSTADEARKWDDKRVAARTQARIADLIWDANPESANNYLKAAWSASASVEEPKVDRSAFVNPSRRNAVRRDVLLVARKRAPELAAKWLQEMVEESKSGDEKERGTFDDRSARSAVLLQMANQLVADNPQAAADLLIESLRDGISFNFQTTLIRIQQKDTALSEKVFRAALMRLRAVGMSDPNELLTLYAYLYTPGRVLGANTADNRNQAQLALGGPRVAVPAGRQNPAMALEFLELASDLLLSTPVPESNNAQIAARSLVSAIGIVLREVRQQLPDKAALLRARAQQLDSEARFSTEPIQRKPDMPEFRPGESKESFADRRVDLLEEMAAKGRDVLTRDIGYATAAVATTVERYERGLDLAGKIDEENLRDGVRSWLLYRAVLNFIAAGNLDQAHRLNLKNADAATRAVCLVVGAQRLVKDKDTDRAGEWLRQAGAILKRSEPNEGVARTALGMVATYGRFDTQAALDWLLCAVKLMRKNQPASLNDDRAPSIKRISGITTTSDFTSNTTGFSLEAAVAALPPDQFDQVLYILNDITPQETRGMALLTLCSNLLKTMPNATKNLSQVLSSVPALKSAPQ
jgi:hypothetical protein